MITVGLIANIIWITLAIVKVGGLLWVNETVAHHCSLPGGLKLCGVVVLAPQSTNS